MAGRLETGDCGPAQCMGIRARYRVSMNDESKHWLSVSPGNEQLARSVPGVALVPCGSSNVPPDDDRRGLRWWMLSEERHHVGDPVWSKAAVPGHLGRALFR